MRAVYFEKSVPRVLGTLALKTLWPGAVFFGPTSPVRLADLPTPPLPGPRGVRVQNRLCGVCASDLHLVFVNVHPKVHPAALPGRRRLYLGHEVVGEVTEVGPEVRDLAPGDRVVMESRFTGATCRSQGIAPPCRACGAGDYGLCENASADVGGVGGGWGDGYTADRSEVYQVPDALSDEQAVLIEPLACSLRAVLRRTPGPDETALVLGCGMIGLGVIQALRAVQPRARVLAAARHPQQVALAERFGATVIDPGRLYEEVARLTNARIYTGELKARTMIGGVDVVYDCVGRAATLEPALRLVRAGGAVVLVGVNLRRLKVDLTPIWHQQVDLIGTIVHGHETWQGEQLSTFELVARWLARGELDGEGLLTHRFALARWKEAVRTAVDKRSGAVRVMIEPT